MFVILNMAPWVKTHPHKHCKKNVFQVSDFAEKIHSCSQTVTKVDVTCIVKFRHVLPARRCLPDAYLQLSKPQRGLAVIAGWLGFVWQRYVRVHLRLSWTLRDLQQPQPWNRAMVHLGTTEQYIRWWGCGRLSGWWKAPAILCVCLCGLWGFFLFCWRASSQSALEQTDEYLQV